MNTTLHKLIVNNIEITHKLGEDVQGTIDSLIVLAKLSGAEVEYIVGGNAIQIQFNQNSGLSICYNYHSQELEAMFITGGVRMTEVTFISIDPEPIINCFSLTKDNFDKLIEALKERI